LQSYLVWLCFVKAVVAGERAAIGFVLPKPHWRRSVGKNLQPLKLQDNSSWLCFAKMVFASDQVSMALFCRNAVRAAHCSDWVCSAKIHL
jgi:hypothetical protein